MRRGSTARAADSAANAPITPRVMVTRANVDVRPAGLELTAINVRIISSSLALILLILRFCSGVVYYI